jgi:Fe-S-cluster containining protein
MAPSILYPHMPPMAACDHCGRCCGPVTVTRREGRVIAEYMVAHDVRWRARPRSLTCGFYDARAKACRIYPVRPFACRLFGVAFEMRCKFYPQAAVLSFPAERAIDEGWLQTDGVVLDYVVERWEATRCSAPSAGGR